MSRHNHLFFIILFVLSSSILSKNLLKKSDLRNENTVSDKSSKNKALQPSVNWEFDYYFESYNSRRAGEMDIKCGKLKYPIKLSKLITYNGGKLEENHLGQGNLNDCCPECEIKKNVGNDNKYEILIVCDDCKSKSSCGGKGPFRVKMDLRPILTRYFDY